MATGPTAGSPAPPAGAGPRRIALNVVITEPLDGPLADPAGFDTGVAASVYAVLQDNGYAVKVELAREDAAAGWPMPARQLIALTAEVAAARRRATTASAEAYLAAEGTQYARAAAADLAAAADREDLETLEGRAEAWRWVLSQTGPPEPESAGPAMPRPPEPDASWPRYARDV